MWKKHESYLAWFWSISFVVWAFMATLKGCYYDNLKLDYEHEVEKIKAEKGTVDTQIDIIEE